MKKIHPELRTAAAKQFFESRASKEYGHFNTSHYCKVIEAKAKQILHEDTTLPAAEIKQPK